MANTLLTLGGITRRAIQLFRNSNAFLQSIDRQFDSKFGVEGAKVGSSLSIRLPNDYTVRSGATASAQNTVEVKTTLTVASQKGVDVSFTSADMALSIDDFAYRILEPMVNVLAGGVAADIMSGAEAINNLVHATTAGATITPTSATWLQAGAILDFNSCPRHGRTVIADALTMSRTVNTLTGLFNPSSQVSKQYQQGLVSSNTLGFEDWKMDQTVLLHTAGTFVSGTVNGGSQTGSAITVNSTTGTLVVGDIVTFAGCFGVNRITKTSTGVLQQFVITAAAAGSSTSLSIYPALTPIASGAYATCSASPANSAAIAAVVAASEVYRKNFAFHPQAVVMATADLDLPTGAVVSCARENYSGISLRMIRDYNSTSDGWLTRLDILYGYLWVRPEWAVIVADAV